MHIEFGERFIAQLQVVLDFIAQDSITNALNFECELLDKIQRLDSMPRKCQKIHSL